jgi:hypothetical protein
LQIPTIIRPRDHRKARKGQDLIRKASIPFRLANLSDESIPCQRRASRILQTIDLGAKFIHGDADETQAVLDEADLRSVDVAGRRLESNHGRLRVLDDIWSRLHRVMRHLPTAASRDVSFAEFLHRRPEGPRNAHNRHLALQFIEGFMAADPRRVSAHSMAGQADPTGDPAAQQMGRVLDGYDHVVGALAGPVAACIHRSIVVTRVQWKPGRVRIESKSATCGRPRPPIRARRLVVTVPLGVLQAPFGSFGSIEFDPPLNDKVEALARRDSGRTPTAPRAPEWDRSSYSDSCNRRASHLHVGHSSWIGNRRGGRDAQRQP